MPVYVDGKRSASTIDPSAIARIEAILRDNPGFDVNLLSAADLPLVRAAMANVARECVSRVMLSDPLSGLDMDRVFDEQVEKKV